MGLWEEMKKCNACQLRSNCIQVVLPDGNYKDPLLMIIGEASGADEDESGVPFVGRSGQLLRACLRETRVINRNNTIISNVLKCRPPNNKFPTDDTPRTCFSKWLSSEIEVLAPKRMLLLGAQALKFVAGMKGITSVRGNWMRARGIRMMATFHPSYVLRQEGEGDPTALASFKGDIANVAAEVAELEREG